MKRIFLIFILFICINLSSQTYRKFVYDVNDEYSYHNCYHSIVLDDGNIVLLDYLLKGQEYDRAGYTLLKLDRRVNVLIDKEIIDLHSLYDSVYIDNIVSLTYSSFLVNNPIEENSNMYITFYKNPSTGFYHYHALCFDDDLNYTKTIDEALHIDSINISSLKVMLDHNNDLVFCISNSMQNNYILLKTDIYGKMKLVKRTDIVPTNYKIYNKSLFMCEQDDTKYGLFLKNEGYNEYGYQLAGYEVFTFDENFKQTGQNNIYQFDIPSLSHTVRLDSDAYVAQIIKLKDGNFALISGGYTPTKDILILLKLDKDFNVINYDAVGMSPHEENCNHYAQYHPLVECESGSLYVTFLIDDGTRSKWSGVVKRYDKDINLLWETTFKETSAILDPIIRTSLVLDDGNLAITGIETGTYHDHSVVCYVFKNNGAYIPENDDSTRPYSFYPNPASNTINIRFSPDVNVEKVEIYGMDGKMYHEQNFNMETININSLSNGIYMMKVVLDNGNTYTDKIAVK